MQQSKIDALTKLFGKKYRENIGTLAKDMLEELFNISAQLGIDPKMLMRELILQRPQWPSLPSSQKTDLDLALRLMSAEDETIRTLNAQAADAEVLEQGIKLLGMWTKTHFQKEIVQRALTTSKPFVRRLAKAFPELGEEDLLFFLLDEFQEQLTYHPTDFKDSGLLEDILQKMLF